MSPQARNVASSCHYAFFHCSFLASTCTPVHRLKSLQVLSPLCPGLSVSSSHNQSLQVSDLHSPSGCPIVGPSTFVSQSSLSPYHRSLQISHSPTPTPPKQTHCSLLPSLLLLHLLPLLPPGSQNRRFCSFLMTSPLKTPKDSL